MLQVQTIQLMANNDIAGGGEEGKIGENTHSVSGRTSLQLSDLK